MEEIHLVEKVFAFKLTTREVSTFFGTARLDGSGSITYREFFIMMKALTSSGRFQINESKIAQLLAARDATREGTQVLESQGVEEDFNEPAAAEESLEEQLEEETVASPGEEALQLFGALSKTLACSWDGDAILVEGCVRIENPYTPVSCSAGSEFQSQMLLKRVRNRLALERAGLKRSGSLPPPAAIEPRTMQKQVPKAAPQQIPMSQSRPPPTPPPMPPVEEESPMPEEEELAQPDESGEDMDIEDMEDAPFVLDTSGEDVWDKIAASIDEEEGYHPGIWTDATDCDDAKDGLEVNMEDVEFAGMDIEEAQALMEMAQERMTFTRCDVPSSNSSSIRNRADHIAQEADAAPSQEHAGREKTHTQAPEHDAWRSEDAVAELPESSKSADVKTSASQETLPFKSPPGTVQSKATAVKSAGKAMSGWARPPATWPLQETPTPLRPPPPPLRPPPGKSSGLAPPLTTSKSMTMAQIAHIAKTAPQTAQVSETPLPRPVWPAITPSSVTAAPQQVPSPPAMPAPMPQQVSHVAALTEQQRQYHQNLVWRVYILRLQLQQSLSELSRFGEMVGGADKLPPVGPPPLHMQQAAVTATTLASPATCVPQMTSNPIMTGQNAVFQSWLLASQQAQYQQQALELAAGSWNGTSVANNSIPLPSVAAQKTESTKPVKPPPPPPKSPPKETESTKPAKPPPPPDTPQPPPPPPESEAPADPEPPPPPPDDQSNDREASKELAKPESADATASGSKDTLVIELSNPPSVKEPTSEAQDSNDVSDPAAIARSIAEAFACLDDFDDIEDEPGSGGEEDNDTEQSDEEPPAKRPRTEIVNGASEPEVAVELVTGEPDSAKDAIAESAPVEEVAMAENSAIGNKDDEEDKENYSSERKRWGLWKILSSPAQPGEVWSEGVVCSRCRKPAAPYVCGGIFCGRMDADGTFVGCSAGVCWRCMKRAPREALGEIRTSKVECDTLGEDAWWMHDFCMRPSDRADYYASGSSQQAEGDPTKAVEAVADANADGNISEDQANTIDVEVAKESEVEEDPSSAARFAWE